MLTFIMDLFNLNHIKRPATQVVIFYFDLNTQIMRTELFIVVIALTVTLNNCSEQGNPGSEESGFFNTVGRILTIKNPFSAGVSFLNSTYFMSNIFGISQ